MTLMSWALEPGLVWDEWVVAGQQEPYSACVARPGSMVPGKERHKDNLSQIQHPGFPSSDRIMCACHKCLIMPWGYFQHDMIRESLLMLLSDPPSLTTQFLFKIVLHAYSPTNLGCSAAGEWCCTGRARGKPAVTRCASPQGVHTPVDSKTIRRCHVTRPRCQANAVAGHCTAPEL